MAADAFCGLQVHFSALALALTDMLSSCSKWLKRRYKSDVDIPTSVTGFSSNSALLRSIAGNERPSGCWARGFVLLISMRYPKAVEGFLNGTLNLRWRILTN